MMKKLMILLLFATPAHAGLDYFSQYKHLEEKPEPKKIERNYTLIRSNELTPLEWEFVKEHEKQTDNVLKKTITGEYEIDCLNLVEKVIQQSYEGCLLTTNLKTNVADISGQISSIKDKEKGKQIDIKEQTNAHNKQLKKMKNGLCKSAMKAAKYHKQQAYCRIHQPKQWYDIANQMLELKLYKYIGIYIKKTDIIWRGLPDEKYKTTNIGYVRDLYGQRVENERWKTFDDHFRGHPANLAGNTRNLAYDTDNYYMDAYYTVKSKENSKTFKKVYQEIKDQKIQYNW